MNFKNTIVSSVADGKEWLKVQSKKIVLNLNSEFLGGFRFNEYARKKKFYIGDNESKSFRLDHFLGSEDLVVSVTESNKQINYNEYNVKVIDSNSILISFSNSLPVKKYKVVIVG